MFMNRSRSPTSLQVLRFPRIDITKNFSEKGVDCFLCNFMLPLRASIFLEQGNIRNSRQLTLPAELRNSTVCKMYSPGRHNSSWLETKFSFIGLQHLFCRFRFISLHINFLHFWSFQTFEVRIIFRYYFCSNFFTGSDIGIIGRTSWMVHTGLGNMQTSRTGRTRAQCCPPPISFTTLYDKKKIK